MTQDTNLLMRQAAQSIQDNLERQLFLGKPLATTCAAAPEPATLTVDELLKSIQSVRSMLPVVWYRFCDYLPEEIKGEPCYAVAVKFGKDQVFMVRRDSFETFQRLMRPANFVEYPQERLERRMSLEAEAMLGLAMIDIAKGLK